MATVRIPINAGSEAGMAQQLERGLKFHGFAANAPFQRLTLTGLDGGSLTGAWGRPPFMGIAEVDLGDEAVA